MRVPVTEDLQIDAGQLIDRLRQRNAAQSDAIDILELQVTKLSELLAEARYQLSQTSREVPTEEPTEPSPNREMRRAKRNE